jgi:hypothetical protein
MSTSPATLQEAILHFSNVDNCIAYLVERRWKNGVICPNCGSSDVAFIASRRVWQCKTRHPKAQFSVKVGTIMEDSALGLDKWLTAIWMITNCTFIGGKARNMHKDVRARKIKGTGSEGKAIVAAVLKRGGKVRTGVMEDRKKATLQRLIRENV